LELLQDEDVAYEVSEDIRVSKWMEYSPASESQLLAAEERIVIKYQALII
jgi:hypothetical protein